MPHNKRHWIQRVFVQNVKQSSIWKITAKLHYRSGKLEFLQCWSQRKGRGVGQARVHKYHSQSRTIEACKYTIINSSVQIDLHVEEDKYSLVGLTGSGMQPITYIVMCTLSLSYPTPPFLGLELYVRNRRNVYLSFHPFSTNTYHLTGT